MTIEPREPRTVNSREAALILGISEQTLRHWRQRGFGPRYVKYGKARNAPVRYRLVEIERWMSLQELQATYERAAA
jgi:predicted site-specific integrase-resolvase